MTSVSTLKKVGAFGLLAVVAVSLTGCNPWDRIKGAKSAAVVAYEFDDRLIPFDSNGNVIDGGSSDVGVGEAAGALGGLFGGKGVDGVKDAVASRQTREAKSQVNYNNFKSDLKAKFPDLLSKARISVVKFDPIPSADLGIGSISKSLVTDSGADAVVVLHTTAGYVKEEGMFGLNKTYQLCIKTKVTIGDKDGKMGDNDFFAISTVKRPADGGLPVFESDDFKEVSSAIISQIQSAILEVKLQ